MTIVGRVPADLASPAGEHLVSVVIPTYRPDPSCRHCWPRSCRSPSPVSRRRGRPFRVAEVLLVHDCGPATRPACCASWSGLPLRPGDLAEPQLRPARGDPRRHGVLRRRLDRHHGRGRPARPRRTSARCSTSRCAEQASVVYAEPTNPPPHGALRNARLARWRSGSSTRSSGGTDAADVPAATGSSSARSAAASRRTPGRASTSTSRWAGWPAAPPTAPVSCATRVSAPSGYSTRTLLSHFWRMVLTGGTRGLRLVSVLGVVFALLGVVLARRTWSSPALVGDPRRSRAGPR